MYDRFVRIITDFVYQFFRHTKKNSPTCGIERIFSYLYLILVVLLLEVRYTGCLIPSSLVSQIWRLESISTQPSPERQLMIEQFQVIKGHFLHAITQSAMTIHICVQVCWNKRMKYAGLRVRLYYLLLHLNAVVVNLLLR